MKLYETITARLQEAVTRETWSLYLGYLILAGIPLLLALPQPTRLDDLIEPRISFLAIFSATTALLFIVYSFNLGAISASSLAPHANLIVRITVLLLLSLPYWTVYQGLMALELDRLPWALIYLGFQGLCWGYAGVLIARRWQTEITQFNIKYALLALILIATFFVLQPLNPFVMLSLWFGEGPLHGQAGFLVMGYLGTLTILAILSIWAVRSSLRPE